MLRFRSVLLLFALPLAACSKDAASRAGDSAAAASSASASGGDHDLENVQSYELTMERIDRMYAAQRNMALRMKDMSPAEREAFRNQDAADPNASIDDLARKFDSNPAMRGAIRDAGLSTREFALGMFAMFQSSMAAAVLQQRPKDNADSLIREMKANPKNVRFIQEHQAELTKKQKDMEAEMKRLGVASEG